MARLLLPLEIFDDLRRETNFTIARLEDEPRAAHLLTFTTEWESRIDETERFFRQVEKESVRVDAARIGGNQALDAVVMSFSQWLDIAVGRNHDAARWRRFFRDDAPSDFVRQPLQEQAATVQGWLSDTDEALVPFRADLQAALGRVERAANRETELAITRGRMWEAREKLAQFLTGSRDALEAQLEQLARDNGLPRTWAGTFFLKRRSSEAGPPAGTPPATPT